MPPEHGNYHEGRDDATGEIQWNDRPRYRSSNVNWPDPLTQTDQILKAIENIQIGDFVALLDAGPDIRRFTRPFSRLRVIDVLNYLKSHIRDTCSPRERP